MLGSREDGEYNARVREAEIQSVVRGLVLPTTDQVIRQCLRIARQPVCKFAEGPGERRARLRRVIAVMTVNGTLTNELEEMLEGQNDTMQLDRRIVVGAADMEYSGHNNLRSARIEIARLSLKASSQLVRQQKLFRSKMADTRKERNLQYLDLVNDVQGFSPLLSQVGCKRPMSACSLSKDGDLLCTGSFGGIVKIWNCTDGTSLGSGIINESRICDVAFGIDNFVASASSNGRLTIWKLKDNMDMDDEENNRLSKLWEVQAHGSRVARIAWHPIQRYLLSTGYDCTWKLWDIETKQELAVYSGHRRGLHSISVQNEGALVVTGDLGGSCRLWDLRVGKRLFDLRGHVKSVLTSRFSSDGFHVATGSLDNTAKLWDLRAKKCQYTFAAHLNLVSDVGFGRRSGAFVLDGDGEYLMTASYDKKIKFWSLRSFACVKTLPSHEDKVMRACISDSGDRIASVCYDKTWKLWGLHTE